MALIRVNRLPPEYIPGPTGLEGRQGPVGPRGPSGSPGRDGRDGRDGIDGKNVDESELKALLDRLTKLEKRKDSGRVGGGNAAVTSYNFTDQAVSHWTKHSFIHGLNIIGVRYSGAATVYLPGNLDREMIISVKDESGSGNITIFIE